MISEDFPSDTQGTLTVNLGAVTDNYRRCIDLAGGVDCAAMVKADAYGMGIAQVAPVLFHRAGCRIFFVADLAEAVKLRRILPKAVIYVLSGIFTGHVQYFIRHNIRPVLNDLNQIRIWAESSAPTPCAIHFDTGINRLGLSPEETGVFINDINLQHKLDIALVMSHLACADDAGNPANLQQLNAFREIRRHFPAIPASLANSGGILLGPDYHFDLIRPGLLLYGGNPHPGDMPENIRPVCQIFGKILQIRALEAGQTVGYGATWTADRPCHIATINIGYADGYPQMFNNCGMVYIKGRIFPVVGRVSMDMIAVDVTGIMPGEIARGNEVELLGKHITLEMASEVSTLSQYEILTGVRERYRRVYI